LIFPAILIGVPLIARLNVGGERRRIREWAAPFLEPGEQIQAAFKIGLPVVFGTYGHLDPHVIVATDRAILTLHLAWGRATPPRRLTMRLPRNHRFGRPRVRSSYVLQPSVVVDGKTLVVPRRFFTDVAAADAALDGTTPTPYTER
jgi:hypothetical protein